MEGESSELKKCPANFAPLSPLGFLARAEVAYRDRASVIYGKSTRFTWGQTADRCRRVASSLIQNHNVNKGDIISLLAPNVPTMYESHFAVPMAGAVLNAINTRLDGRSIATIVSHCNPKIFIVDYQLAPLAQKALSFVPAAFRPQVIVANDDDRKQSMYEDLVRNGDPNFRGVQIEDEWDSISLNYTSGTTSAPKGVVYSHRGAYLNCLSMLLLWNMGTFPVYLWTLPMFHCNGWTFTWALAARGGTSLCLRSMSVENVYSAIHEHSVTHMCCAPTVFNMLLAKPTRLAAKVYVLVGGAPPPPAVLEKIEALGFNVTHAYGLTEATGPALVCEWKEEWDGLSARERANLKRRQGVPVLGMSEMAVKDPDTMISVANDGAQLGEIMLKGSVIMKGYLKDAKSTGSAFGGGWFRTGDVAVVHGDGYVEIKDRSKDVIISGAENISSVEVESALYGNPKVAEAAVVAMPHPLWGETPCAFICPAQGTVPSGEEIIKFCKGKLPGFMVPKHVILMKGGLPKTSTGKIQKNVLRAMALERASINPNQTGLPTKKLVAPYMGERGKVCARL